MMIKLILAFIILENMVVWGVSEEEEPSFEDVFLFSQPSTIKDVREVFVPPQNTNDSIYYTLFTRKNPQNPCFLEPTPEDFKNCPFDPNLETKILIHGFFVRWTTFPTFLKIKDALLQYQSYNIIYVHWHRYNDHPYFLAKENTIPVGKRVADFIKFIKEHTGASFCSIHIIGHSLGSHIAGIAGKQIAKIAGKQGDKIGRITGLDTAGLFYDLDPRSTQLYYTDAIFVDTIHTSDEHTGEGFGKYAAHGHMDFYPNGGRIQEEHCGDAYKNLSLSGDVTKKLEGPYYVALCSHVMAIKYFYHSIFDCEYRSTKCKNYESLSTCSSKGNPTARMGFHAKPIKGLRPERKFFLKTSAKKPFCEKNP